MSCCSSRWNEDSVFTHTNRNWFTEWQLVDLADAVFIIDWQRYVNEQLKRVAISDAVDFADADMEHDDINITNAESNGLEHSEPHFN